MLKPFRKYNQGSEIRFYMNEAAERGVIVVYDTSLTGSYSLDDVNNAVKLPTASYTAEAPAGLLLCDVVSTDPSLCCRNFHKDEVPVTGKVSILRHGWVTTNSIDSSVTGSIVAGEDAYFVEDGELTNVAGSTKVGTFMTPVDSSGYAVVDINVGSQEKENEIE